MIFYEWELMNPSMENGTHNRDGEFMKTTLAEIVGDAEYESQGMNADESRMELTMLDESAVYF